MEDHHEDCGEDFGPLGEDYSSDHVFEHPPEVVTDSEDEICCIVNLDHGLNGSTFEPDEQHNHSDSRAPMVIDDLECFVA